MLNNRRPIRRNAWTRVALAAAQLSDSTLGHAIGRHPRQQLTWLGLLSAPLLIPVAIPGMSTTVGALCLLIALSVLIARPIPLPGWLHRRRLPASLGHTMHKVVHKLTGWLSRFSQPRMLQLSSPRFRYLNGCMLALAGVSMMIPVPMISFDNVVPAAAVTLLAWGLRIRDGGMLMVGYITTFLAWAYVGLLWWGGAELLTWLYSLLPANWFGAT